MAGAAVICGDAHHLTASPILHFGQPDHQRLNFIPEVDLGSRPHIAEPAIILRDHAQQLERHALGN